MNQPIYNFYTNMTSAPIVNYFSKILSGGVRLVNYEVRDIPNNNIYGDQAKVFTLGYEGQPFMLLISKEDVISIGHRTTDYLKCPTMDAFFNKYSGGSSEVKPEMKELKSYLFSMVRESKLNQVLND